jgi:hypothetical protein
MSLTLEQLDQFGSLDSLPFSLDNNWTDEGVCGPFTLEGLDAFWQHRLSRVQPR